MVDDFLIKYNKHINWNVSGFGLSEKMNLLKMIIEILEDFNIDNPIKTIHGSYASRFNSGRAIFETQEIEHIKKEIRWFNNHNVGIKLTFSSPFINSKDFNNRELRFYLDILSENKNVKNGIICQVDELAKFIKNEYPSLEIVSSYCKCGKETKFGKTDTIDYYNRLFDLYDIIVMNNYHAFDDEFLSQIKYKEKIEFIVNNQCIKNCQIVDQHHDIIANLSNLNDQYLKNKNRQIQLLPKINQFKDQESKICDNCLHNKFRLVKNKNLDFIISLNKSNINHLLDLGINNFKIEGRESAYHIYFTYLFKYIINIDSHFINLFSIYGANEK